jgi:hypothetical protein
MSKDEVKRNHPSFYEAAVKYDEDGNKMSKKLPALYCSIYSMLVDTARENGYALAVHGSMTRDFDILAVPWVDVPAEPQELFEAIKKSITCYFPEDPKHDVPEIKPHGRIAYNILLDGGYFLDLSIMPPRKKTK